MPALAVTAVRYRLRTPLRAAWGDLHERELLRVRLAFSDRDFGYGEAAPLEPYDGVPMAGVRAALEVYGSVLRAVARPDTPHGEILAACRAERDLPQALAAVDLALWDRASRHARTPVAELIDPAPLAAVPVNATIGAEDRAGAARAAAEAKAAGFRCVKVKVGIGDDAGRVAAVRAAVGPELAIRVDANGAWSTPEEALANLRALAPANIELCEEPVHGVAALRAVRAQSPVPVAMDETYAPGAGAADAVCLKVARGGISGVLADAAAARAAGSSVYLASTYDGPIGIAAAVHAAAALHVSMPCGLATLAAFDDVPAALVPQNGAIIVPKLDGLAM